MSIHVRCILSAALITLVACDSGASKPAPAPKPAETPAPPAPAPSPAPEPPPAAPAEQYAEEGVESGEVEQGLADEAELAARTKAAKAAGRKKKLPKVAGLEASEVVAKLGKPVANVDGDGETCFVFERDRDHKVCFSTSAQWPDVEKQNLVARVAFPLDQQEWNFVNVPE